MAYTETTHKSWFSRLTDSVFGVLIGVAAIFFGTLLLWWNEEDFFKTAGAIGEAELVTQEMPDISKINSEYEGKLIYASGFADTKDVLKDDIFGVQANAVKLERQVEYYQWQEHIHTHTNKTAGGGETTTTTYTYSKEWTEEPIDSSSFSDFLYKRKNFVLATFNDSTFIAANVKFGAYMLPDFLKSKYGGAIPIEMTSEIINEIDINTIEKNIQLDEKYKGSKNTVELIHFTNKGLYIGNKVSEPQIGDVRIRFTKNPPGDISIVAQVTNNTFEEFQASNGYTFSRIEMGKLGIKNMFENAKRDNKIETWIIRAVSAGLVIYGFKMMFIPISVFFDIIPFLGSLVGIGSDIFAIFIGLSWSLIVIAISWLRLRPVISACLILTAIASVFILSRIKISRYACTDDFSV